MRKNRILRGLGMAALASLVAIVAGQIVMRLWNWMMPDLFGWGTIDFWRALGLLVLSRILFGGFGRGGRGHRGHWRQRMSERWEKMTPEQREQLRDGMRSRCRHFEMPSEPPAAEAKG